jgi:heat shock protein HspQ
MVAPVFSPPKFRPGQLVRHRRYGYRGVVVAVDLSCRASDEWYQRNKTQPLRAQAWYHVLVDGGELTTYAAETSLEEDESGRPVAHPLVTAFFSGFTPDGYERNDRPWVVE